jgi:Major Facilitator Superfamily/Sigma-70, region 4
VPPVTRTFIRLLPERSLPTLAPNNSGAAYCHVLSANALQGHSACGLNQLTGDPVRLVRRQQHSDLPDVVRLSSSSQRRTLRRSRVALTFHETSSLQTRLETERIRLVRQAIKRLPSKLRTAIEICQAQDGSLSDLAMLAGVSLPTMKSRLLRARLKLREPLSRVLKVRSVPKVLPRTNEADSARRISRRQGRSEKSAVARDHHSVSDRTLRLNDISVTTNSDETGHWVIGLQPMAQAIMADSFEPKKRGRAFALYGLVAVLAPSLGPTIGGWITDNYSWRWIFYINLPVGILAFFLVRHLVQDPPWINADRANLRKLDYIGLGLLTVAMGGLQIMLDKGEENDWFGSTFIRVFALLFVSGMAGLIWWQLRAKNPIMNLRLFKYKNFAICSFLMILVGGVLNAATVLEPQFLQQLMGYTATRAGEALAGGGLVLLIVMPLAGIATGKFPAKIGIIQLQARLHPA